MKFSFVSKLLEAKKSIEFSKLYDELSFYSAFLRDLKYVREEVIIESPFITKRRMSVLFPIFERLKLRGVRIYIITRDPREHNDRMAEESEIEIRRFESIGVQVLLCKGNHHRKLAILDREKLWEGSLNILSQTNSREFMRRIEGKNIAMDTLRFLKIEQYL
jgi:phosphatidylserine/phosphatidylglycerophosphate/cardiolipin synthase-like enzyme